MILYIIHWSLMQVTIYYTQIHSLGHDIKNWETYT